MDDSITNEITRLAGTRQTKQYLDEMISHVQSSDYYSASLAVKLFTDLEDRYMMHENAYFMDEYRELILSFREKILIMFGVNDLKLDYLFPLHILRKIDIAGSIVDIEAQINEIKDRYEESTDPVEKLFSALKILMLYTYSGLGEEGLKIFTKYALSLPTREIFDVSNNFEQWGKYIPKFIYGDAANLIKQLEDNIFGKSFNDKTTMDKKKALAWLLPFFWETMGNDVAFLDLYPTLYDRYLDALEANDDEAVFTLHLYLLFLNAYLNQDVSKQTTFNENVDKKLSEYCVKRMNDWEIQGVLQSHNHEKRKVGFVVDEILDLGSENLLTIVQELSPFYDVYIYNIDVENRIASSQSMIDKFTALSAKYHSAHASLPDRYTKDYYNHFDKSMLLRKKILDDEIDTLICTSGTSQQTFLLSTRTSSEQIYFHQNNPKFDVAGIDKRISLGDTEDVVLIGEFTFKQFSLHSPESFMKRFS